MSQRICAHASRWRNLSLALPSDCLVFLHDVPPGTSRGLECFSLVPTARFERVDIGRFSFVQGNEVLGELYLQRNRLLWYPWGLLLCPESISFNVGRYAKGRGFVRGDNILRLLAMAPQLRELRLTVRGSISELPPPITLLRLIQLYIFDSDSGPILDSLTLPRLELLNIQGSRSRRWPAREFISLMTRSACRLQKIYYWLGSSPKDMRDSLQSVPSVQELNVLYGEVVTTPLINAMTPPDDPNDPTPVLLPQLRLLELPANMRCPHDRFAAMIRTRLDQARLHKTRRVTPIQELIIQRPGTFDQDVLGTLEEYKNRGLELIMEDESPLANPEEESEEEESEESEGDEVTDGGSDVSQDTGLEGDSEPDSNEEDVASEIERRSTSKTSESESGSDLDAVYDERTTYTFVGQPAP